MIEINVKHKRGAFDLNVHLLIPQSGITALLGPSGSGKSTLLRLLAGLEQTQIGRITSDGKVWFDSESKIFVTPQQRKVGILFQDYALFSHLSVAKNIAYGLTNKKDKKLVVHWLEKLHINDLADRYPHQLSGGQRQRVAMARAMVAEPELLLLDEPFSALDINMRQHLRNELKAVINETNIPVILVTHDLNDARYLADHVGVLCDGRLHRFGATEQVFTDPRSRATASMLGWQNILPVTDILDHKLKGPWGEVDVTWSVSPDTDWLAIRAEHVRIAASDDHPNTVVATIESITDLGAYRAICCRLDDNTPLYMHYAWDKPVPTEGTRVRLHLPPQYLTALGESPIATADHNDDSFRQPKSSQYEVSICADVV